MIAIVDYRAGNLTSVLRAVRHLGHEAEITDDPRKIRAAERVIFPGVGAAGETMSNLRKLALDGVLRDDVFRAGKPMLGICIGVQVIFERSEENDAQCLGLLPGEVRRFPARAGLKVPQIGWNSVRQLRPHPIMQGVPDRGGVLLRELLLSRAGAAGDGVRRHRVRPGIRVSRRVGEPGRHAISPGKERPGRAADARQLLPLERQAMLTKRLIPCLDVRAGKVTKGVKFRGNVDIGDPVEFARMYYEEGADELVFYDITASNEGRGIMLEVVRAVAEAIYIPFSVGGGLRTLEDMRAVLLAGAEKVSVDSGAVRNPEIISQGARAFGSQCIVLSMQVQRAPATEKIPSGWEICIDGGRTRTGLDALEWARRGEGLGAGELCVNSIDQDGTRAGYDIPLTRAMAEAVGIPVIASGGGGSAQHVYDVCTDGKADAAILASIIHRREMTIPDLKKELAAMGLPMRMNW